MGSKGWLLVKVVVVCVAHGTPCRFLLDRNLNGLCDCPCYDNRHAEKVRRPRAAFLPLLLSNPGQIEMTFAHRGGMNGR